MDAALSAFDEIGANPGLRGFALYHKALALALQRSVEDLVVVFRCCLVM